MKSLKIKEIMVRAWAIARAGVSNFGGTARHYFREALKMSWSEQEVANEETKQPVREAIEVGDCTIGKDLRYYGKVAGGGDVTPSVAIVTGYDGLSRVRYSADLRSGSKRSGRIAWDLDEDALYVLYDVAYNSRRGSTRWISTYSGVTKELSEREFNAELLRLYPAGAEAAKAKAETRRLLAEQQAVAEAKREREYAERMENRRLELEAEAERIAEEGQGNDGLPDLTGSPKQIAWALKIRAAVVASGRKMSALKTATTAKYWIDNYKGVLSR